MLKNSSDCWILEFLKDPIRISVISGGVHFDGSKDDLVFDVCSIGSL